MELNGHGYSRFTLQLWTDGGQLNRSVVEHEADLVVANQKFFPRQKIRNSDFHSITSHYTVLISLL